MKKKYVSKNRYLWQEHDEEYHGGRGEETERHGRLLSIIPQVCDEYPRHPHGDREPRSHADEHPLAVVRYDAVSLFQVQIQNILFSTQHIVHTTMYFLHMTC